MCQMGASQPTETSPKGEQGRQKYKNFFEVKMTSLSLVTVSDLEAAYRDAVRNNGIIALVKTLRDRQTIKLQDLNSCFANNLWVKSAQSTGHLKFTHKVTKVMIEYQNHGNEVSEKIQKQILEQAQTHINILGNDIFKYATQNWKQEPDFQKALENYKRLRV